MNRGLRAVPQRLAGAPAAYRFLPYLVLGWLLAGLVLTVAIPDFAAKVAGGLKRARVRP